MEQIGIEQTCMKVNAIEQIYNKNKLYKEINTDVMNLKE